MLLGQAFILPSCSSPTSASESCSLAHTARWTSPLQTQQEHEAQQLFVTSTPAGKATLLWFGGTSSTCALLENTTQPARKGSFACKFS